MTTGARIALSAVAGLVGSAVVTTTAHAAGFEKSIVWGGRSAGVAGIATPYMQGADALYFNPAGLAADKAGHTLSFNISPTSSQFKGPINNQNTEETSKSGLLTPLGLTYGFTPSESSWGFGLGAYVSGGSNAHFENVKFFGGESDKTEVKTDLQIMEIAAGAAYRVSDDLKIGLAWRVVMAQANFAFASRSALLPPFPGGTVTIANAKLSGLKDTEAAAFRFGAQYKVSESTELGLTFRSEVNLEATGKADLKVFNPMTGAVLPTASATDKDATARTTFPMAVTLGALHKLNEDWNLLGEYVWTQYSRVGEINVESDAFASTGGKTSLKTEWADQHNVRVAAEYLSPWPVRFGYIWTNTVTKEDHARASFTPPGPAHTVTLGTGKAFEFGEQNLRFDAAFEYTTTSGDVGNGAAAGGNAVGGDTRNGKYSVNAYVAHLGLTYSF
jgi:long-chain fatty acid transport protein